MGRQRGVEESWWPKLIGSGSPVDSLKLQKNKIILKLFWQRTKICQKPYLTSLWWKCESQNKEEKNDSYYELI